jgi:molecular chaperone DnaK
MTGKVNFIDIDFEMPFEVNTNESSLTEAWLKEQVEETEDNIDNLDSKRKEEFKEKLNKVKNIFETKKTESGRLEARSELQKLAKEVEQIEIQNEWPKLEETLKEEFYKLEAVNNDLGNDKTTRTVNQFRSQLEEVIKAKDAKLGKVLLEEINSFFVQLTLIYQLIGFVRQHNDNFGSYNWKDSSRARTLLNKGLQIIGENPDVEELHPVVISIIDCLVDEDKPTDIFEG